MAYRKQSKKLKESYPERRKKVIENLPCHDHLYRDFHLIEEDILKYIFRKAKLDFERSGVFGTKTTEYDYNKEENYWDIIYTIFKSPDLNDCNLLIEYKSNVNEWHKPVHQFIRQIKNKTRRYAGASQIAVFLISFDPRFKQFEQALEKEKIRVLVLPDYIRNKMKTWDLGHYGKKSF